jgi:Dolichyl-phosphate-mannose-protein mannosyltransferase
MMAAVGGVIGMAPWQDGDVAGLGVFIAALAYLMTRHLRTTGGTPSRSLWLACAPVVVAAFVLRALVGALQHWYDFVPELYRLDVDTYNAEAWAMAEAWTRGEMFQGAYPTLNVVAHEYVTGGVFSVLGHSVLAINVISALLGALSLYYFFATATELVGERRPALWVALLLAAWPSHVLWTSQNYREPWVLYSLARAAHSTVLWLARGERSEWLRAAAFVALVALFRSATGAVVGAVFLGISSYRVARHAPWLLRPAAVLATTAVLVALGYAVVFGPLSPSSLTLSPAILTTLRQRLATGGSAFYPDLVYRDWLDVVAFVPVGVLHLLLAPFPTAATNPAQLGSALENLGLSAIIGGTLLRAWRFRWRDGWATAFISLVLLLGLAVFAVVDANLGTAFRHKIQFLPFLLILLALAWRRSGARAVAATE